MATTFAGGLASEIAVPSEVTIAVTSNGGGPITVTITAGTYRTIFELADQVETDLNAQRPVTAGLWTVSVSGPAAGSTGRTTIAVSAGTYSITWTSTTLRDLFGFDDNLSGVSTSTGDDHVRGLVLPDCPLYLDSGDFRSAPRATDLRQSVTPTGRLFAHVGNVKYRHSGLRYSHVATNKTWIAQETLTNESFERFLLDTQLGQGLSWFVPSSRVVIYGPGGNTVGGSTAQSWALMGVTSMDEIVRRVDEWDGHWRIELPSLISDGG